MDKRFGLIVYGKALGITNEDDMLAMHEKFGFGGVTAYFIPGALFPLSLIVLGVMLIRTRSVEMWIGVLLIVAGIGFPLSRVPREPLLAHADNLLLLISHAAIGFRILRTSTRNVEAN